MMELFATAAIVLFLYWVIRGAGVLASTLAGSRHRAYRQLAAKYGGRCESRGLVDPPTVSFAHQGSSCRVGLAPVVAGQPTLPRTRVVARFGKGLPLRMELMPLSRPAPPQPPRGTRPVRLGLPEFDRGYLVQANDADITRELLMGAGVRQAIDELRKLGPPGGMLVSINPERLLVQVDRNLGLQGSALDAAVRHALAVHDWLQTSVSARLAEGVSIVGVGEADASDAGPPRCEVCGDPIGGAHVRCTACKTPCHRDCWTFVGACSTFGCTSKTCEPS